MREHVRHESFCLILDNFWIVFKDVLLTWDHYVILPWLFGQAGRWLGVTMLSLVLLLWGSLPCHPLRLSCLLRASVPCRLCCQAVPSRPCIFISWPLRLSKGQDFRLEASWRMRLALFTWAHCGQNKGEIPFAQEPEQNLRGLLLGHSTRQMTLLIQFGFCVEKNHMFRSCNQYIQKML
jgi:hypothetical protein